MRYLLIVCCVVNFREQWEWLRRLSTNEVNAPPTPTQTAFHNSLVSACKKLLDNLGKNLRDQKFYEEFSMLSSVSRNFNQILRLTKIKTMKSNTVFFGQRQHIKQILPEQRKMSTFFSTWVLSYHIWGLQV